MPSIINYYCHKFQLAAVYSANEHIKGNEFRYPSYLYGNISIHIIEQKNLLKLRQY